MIIRILTIISILLANYSFGQISIDTFSLKKKLILTVEQNIKWYDSLRNSTLNKQLDLIVERIILDTNVFIKYGNADGLQINYSYKEKTKFKGCCKPTIIIVPSNTVFKFDDQYEEVNLLEKVTTFINTLNKIKVNKVKIIPEKEAVKLWGTNGTNGVIVLQVIDNRSKQLLKKNFKYQK